MGDPYIEFLQRKVKVAPSLGFDVAAGDVNPILIRHQPDAVRWACAGGRRALFEAFGLGKSIQQIEILRLAQAHAGGAVGIVLPLGVRQEFARDAHLLCTGDHPMATDDQRERLRAWLAEDPTRAPQVRFVRTTAEVDPDYRGIHMTNYESVRDGKLDPNVFTAASLDEASVLRSFGSKTYQTFLDLFDKVRYRFVATATPSPNRYKELIHYAGFLGVMDTGQALTRWFKRDSTKANNLTLYPHKEREFWLWVASWALFLQRPSDLGYSDDGYDLPPMTVHYVEVPVDHGSAKADRDGQGNLFRDSALGVTNAAREKRDTLPARVAAVRKTIDQYPGSHWIVWHDLEAERHALEAALPRAAYGHWEEFQDGHPVAIELFERHYSAKKREGTARELFVGPGQKQVLINRKRNAMFAWRKFIDDSGQQGVNCSVFRNEGEDLSSDLILEAMAIGWQRWPGERFYTYVAAGEVASSNPGWCFQQAGWKKCGLTKGGLVILEALPGVEVPDVERKPAAVSIYGDQDLDEREQAVIDFSEGRIPILSAKPVIAGSGCNFQRHCHRAIYAGIGFKFNDFIQSLHRIQRFQQSKPVEVWIVYAESEREVLATLQQKWARHNEMVERMSEIIREYGLGHAAMAQVLQRSIGIERIETAGEGWLVANNDCVAETRSMEENSVDLVVTSIPFANHYEYSPSYNDFGHTDDNDHFWRQMDHLTPELLRILRPGRIACIHVKDRIQFGNVTGAGVPTVSPFHAEAIFHYRAHGFDYMGLITVVTDVVRENNQTYRLGWTEQCKDATKMGVGSPEYVVLLHKPQTDRSKGYADLPVKHDKAAYTRARWQVDAHALWRSSGNRQLTPGELAGLGPDKLAKLFTEHSLQGIYDYEAHVRIGEALEARGALPSKFMSLAPGSHHEDVWHDVNRMLTLNGEQTKRGLENHICLARDSLVLTRRGFLPIQEVETGDLALTHKGRWRRVEVVRNTGVRPVVDLRAQGVAALRLTPDHKLWTRKSEQARARAGAARSKPEWVRADETVGGYVNLKLPPVEPSPLTEQECWLIGRWLADGHVGVRGDFFVSIGFAKLDEFKRMAGALAGTTALLTAAQIRLKGLGEAMKAALAACGSGAAGKQVPVEMLALPPEKARALLQGYLSGDGHLVVDRARWMATSVSRPLLLGMAMLAQRVHGTVASLHAGRAPAATVIEGREVKTQQEWVLSFDLTPGQRRKAPFILDDGAWKKVRSAVPAGEVETWCLRVEEDESFTAEGCIVKNCPLQFDIVDRLIERFTNPGEMVFDPFGGLFTVPYRALKLGRRGRAVELNHTYFLDGVPYLQAMERKLAMPSLFDALEIESA